jgi:glutathione S-transferase
MTSGGILYSFRRCPYAIRARLALEAASGIVEVREVALKAKPPELLEASAKGTVPVLVRPNGEILSDSQAIWRWALGQQPGGGEVVAALGAGHAATLLADCDGVFKQHLDGFRYGTTDASVNAHREAALAILRRWNTLLQQMAAPSTTHGEPADSASRPDERMALGWAVLPFVRQFRQRDPEGFDRQPNLGTLQRWLAAFDSSAALARVMKPPWAWRHPWHSPRWLYHLALEEDWQSARQQGHYDQSTRGKSLAEVGFIHACWSHQLEPTRRRFYADGPALRLLVIDPASLAAAAIPVRSEPAPESGELFPHIGGALPLAAVRLAQRWPPLEPSSP